MAKQKIEAAYGAWQSPIVAEWVAEASNVVSQVKIFDGKVCWLERCAAEGGRQVVRQIHRGSVETITPSEFNVRTRIHEYGGGDYLVAGDTVYFSNDSDQRIYRQSHGKKTVPITPMSDVPMALRYADFAITKDGRSLMVVREQHTGQSVINELVLIPTDGSMKIVVLVSGDDFYASPCVSHDGKKLAWISWNHPAMPWDGTALWQAKFNEHTFQLDSLQKIAGGEKESIYQPQFSPNDELYFVSDKSGWWNFYVSRHNKIETVCPMEAECGYPQWIFGTNTYAFVDNNTLAFIFTEKGKHSLGLICDGKRLTTDFNDVHLEPYLAVLGDQVVVIAATELSYLSIIAYHWRDQTKKVIYDGGQKKIDLAYISSPEIIAFPSSNKLVTYGNFYLPKNPNYCASPKEKLPLIVMIHGGPTASTSIALNLTTQYWTSRGFAVLDVNYGGSTGYGRSYRERLNGQWGVLDVADCVNGVKYLIAAGRVDPKRVVVRGKSAGGFTALCALMFYNLFAAGACYYPVTDLVTMLNDTHKFESHYAQTLIGKYPEDKAIYHERSPINHLNQLSVPIILFQGLKDHVVPPSQTQALIDEMEKKRLPYAYVTFADEGHGFRDAKHIQTALEAELYFYGKLFDFQPADTLPEVKIWNS